MTTLESLRAELNSGQLRSHDYLIRSEPLNDRGEVEGIAVPWGEIANIGSFTEEIARGAVQDSDNAQLWWNHQEPIGKLVENRDDDAGWWIRAMISDTARGRDARTLAKDGVVNRFSIGFQPVEYTIREDEETGAIHVIHTKINVRETSMVPMPAYAGAEMTAARSANSFTPGKETPVTVEHPAAVDLEEFSQVRTSVQTLERQFGQLDLSAFTREEAPAIDTRSAGQYLKDLVSGAEDTLAAYTAMAATRGDKVEMTEAGMMLRAYTGSTTADGLMAPQWVRDLTRLIAEAAPLTQLFASGQLPAQGDVLEFGRLKSNTVQVGEQVNEGDDLVYGKVQVEKDTADIATYGGWSELSRQAIERTTNINLLDLTIRAQGMAMARQLNALVRAMFNSIHAAQVTAGNTIAMAAGATYKNWIGALVQAAMKFEALGLPITALVTNADVFTELAELEAGDGRPVLLVGDGAGNNNVGRLNPVGLTGDLAGLTIRLDAGLATGAPKAAFVNGDAIRLYADAPKRLTDQNIVNLTQQFSIYTYAAVADEIPAAIVPVAFAA